jgi:very-short-patch-repair endonuclease
MGEHISNIPLLCVARRVLRKNQTPQEVILWSRLREGRLGYKFRRQHSFGPYIADFYCPERKLVIEVDGSQHLDQEAYDEKRTRFFEGRGLRVVRFWNKDINTNLTAVVEQITELLS